MPLRLTKKSTPLSILHINSSDSGGGAEKVATRIAEFQRFVGRDSKLLVGYKNTRNAHSFSYLIDRNTVIEADCRRLGQLYYDIRGSHRLIFHPLVRSADIIHLHNLHGHYFNPFTLALLSHEKPIVWTLHDMQAFTGHCVHSFECTSWQTGCGNCPNLLINPAIPIDSTAQLWQDKKSIYDSSHLWIAAPSQWLKNRIDQSILGSHSSVVIPNGVDTNLFKPYSREEIRKKHNLPVDAFIVGSIANGGTLRNSWKGGVRVLNAIQLAKESIPDIIFLNIGDDSPSDLPFIINIPPLYDETTLAELYSAMDVFLLASAAENCPLVVLEAMACGVPVVAFGVGGIPELVRDGKDGILITDKSAGSLAEAFVKLALDKDLRCLFSAESRTKASSHFDIALIARKYEELYALCASDWRKSRREGRQLIPLSQVPEVVKTQDFLAAYRLVSLRTQSHSNCNKQNLSDDQELYCARWSEIISSEGIPNTPTPSDVFRPHKSLLPDNHGKMPKFYYRSRKPEQRGLRIC